MFIRIELTGPVSANSVKNSIANAAAIIRLGRYITVLKNEAHFMRSLVSANHAPRRSEKNIWGTKPSTHMISVFFA